MRIGHFPYKPGGNPYQKLFADALVDAGLNVVRIPPFKAFPLNQALSHKMDLLQLDWPHDWYSGKNMASQWVKRLMYFHGLRKLRRFPCVWTAHNLAAHDAGDQDDERTMLQSLIDCCDGIIVMSNAAKERLVDAYRLPKSAFVRVVPHGHYIDVYKNVVSRSAARADLGLEDSARVVLSLGRILPYKGTDRLITSFCEMAGEGDSLVIAGPVADESLLQGLHELASHRCPEGARVIIRPGFVPDDRLQFFFNASDVVALPFKDILNSGSLLLAMSFGRCVVAPRLGSIPEVVDSEGLFGYDADDEKGLSNALANALRSNDLLERGAESKRFARETYSWDDIGRKTKSLYETILGS